MTQFTYQATSLRNLVKQMLPCAESKNFAESQEMSFGVYQRERKSADQSIVHEHVLYAETIHPTFQLYVDTPLTTDQVETDDVTICVNSRNMDRALASFGQQMVTVNFNDSDELALTTATSDEDGKSIEKTILLQHDVDPYYQRITPAGSIAALSSMMPLLDGLKSVVDIASVRGNCPSMQGVRIKLTPQALFVEGENPTMTAFVEYDDVWLQTPQHSYNMMISTDAVRHLISALTAYGTNDAVYFNLYEDRLSITADGVRMEALIS